MSQKFRLLILFFALFSSSLFSSQKLPRLAEQDVTAIAKEIFSLHACYKSYTSELCERTLKLYLEELDPRKLYFTEKEINQWENPSKELVQEVLNAFENGSFNDFFTIHQIMENAIARFEKNEEILALETEEVKSSPEDLKDLSWAKDEKELLDRQRKVRSIQLDVANKLTDENKDNFYKRIKRQQDSKHADFIIEDLEQKKAFVYSNILKAFAQSLDNQTYYFTPGEASSFIIRVQKRLFGIGAALRDDLNGLTVTKILENGPSEKSKLLKLKDRIIAVDGESIIGMESQDSVNLIRGEENTQVELTVVREKILDPENSETQEAQQKVEEILKIKITRGEVVFKESRFQKAFEPYGDGVIAYLRLYSFYQDNHTSAANDLKQAMLEIKKEHKVKGIILDLRHNTGGLLYPTAVEVAGLFLRKCIVSTIKGHDGKLTHLRNFKSGPFLNEPLVVLASRASASSSEIVIQCLQDFGRAIILGDDHTYGKGTYQIFTLESNSKGKVDERGEFKVTSGRWYTASGKTPQLTGVFSDIVVSGVASELEKGEKYSKYPIENDTIASHFEDDFNDLPLLHRIALKQDYKTDPQKIISTYTQHLPTLKENSRLRLNENALYQKFITELKKEDFDVEKLFQYNTNDLQLEEAKNIIKDLILLSTPLAPLQVAI